MAQAKEPANFLVNLKTPQRKQETFYDDDEKLKTGMGIVWGSQSHMRRRRMILEKHPQVAKLLDPSKPYTIMVALLLGLLGIGTMYIAINSSWPIFFFLLYFVGGTINHSLHVCIHDFTHWAGHKNMNINKLMAIFCNIPMGIPSAITFGKYHAAHHNYLGELYKDPDMPFDGQVWFVMGKFTSIKKFIFFLLLPLSYGGKPFFCNLPKYMFMEQYLNWAVIIATDCMFYYIWGYKAAIYLAIGAYISLGPHFASIHVIAEHFQFAMGLQTYDYQGIWNFFNLNLGYHVEHHDFPNAPWYNLPKIRAAAPEFYEQLPIHTSYWKVLMKFFFDDNFNLNNRTERDPQCQKIIDDKKI